MGAIDAKILAAGRDPAGAEVISPVLAALMRDGASCRIVGEAYAARVFEAHGLPFQSLETLFPDAAPSVEMARAILARDPPDLFIGGTSSGPSIEKYLNQAAREQGVPSLSVLDAWLNFRTRFEDESGGAPLAFLPDKIAAIDQFCIDEMLAEGFPADRLAITGPGTPYLDMYVSSSRQASAEEALRTRAQWGASEGRRVFVFASQPFSRDYGDDTSAPGHLGYTEKEILGAFLDAWDRAGLSGVDIAVVKLHPREDKEEVAALMAGRSLGVALDQSTEPRLAVMAADAVIGISSQIIIEAILNGTPAISLQPGLRRKDPLAVVTKTGACPVAYTVEDATALLGRVLGDASFLEEIRASQSSFNPDGGSTARIVALARDMLGLGESRES